MIGTAVQTTPPSTTPIDLAAAKSYCRVTTTDDDDLLQDIIDCATGIFENLTSRQLITASWAYYLDSFPRMIMVPHPPLISVTQIQYTDVDGDIQTLDPELYDYDAKSEPGRIEPAYGQSWPSTRDVMNAVTVTYSAGYGNSGSDVPQPIRFALRRIVGALYDQREDFVQGNIAELRLPMTVLAILQSYDMRQIT